MAYWRVELGVRMLDGEMPNNYLRRIMGRDAFGHLDIIDYYEADDPDEEEEGDEEMEEEDEVVHWSDLERARYGLVLDEVANDHNI